MANSTFQNIVNAQGGLTHRQKEELENRSIRPCHKQCAGSECEWCGGSGLRRKCNSMDCIEHGCNGSGQCDVRSNEVEQLLASK